MKNNKHKLLSEKTPGYVYIVSNPSHIGWLKIGVTENIKARLNTYQTGDPKRAYKVEYYVFHSDCYKAEKQIKENMKYFALRIKNEWYEVDLGIAKSRLDEIVENYDTFAGTF